MPANRQSLPPQASIPPVAIVGAGLLGRLFAWRLLRQGIPVELFEAGSLDRPRAAAHTAAAMISPLSEVVASEPAIHDMGRKSLALWPRWIDELNQSPGNQFQHSPVTYAANGSLLVAHPQDYGELLQFKRELQHKLGDADPSQWLEPEQISEREPDLGHFSRALYLPDEAYLDNRQLLKALYQQIRALGGRCHEGKAVEPETLARQGFQQVLDCRGIGGQTAASGLRGVRGEVLWVETREVSFRHAIRLCHPRYQLYLVPKPGHRFIIGATEIESEDLSPISLQSHMELASALYTIHPAFAEARIIETDVNLRPAYNDNLPRIEREGDITRINGLYRHGYLLAPHLVQTVMEELMAGHELARINSES